MYQVQKTVEELNAIYQVGATLAGAYCRGTGDLY